jgi:hypothetical protein
MASPLTSVDRLGRSRTMMHGKIAKAVAAAGLALALCTACGRVSSQVDPPPVPVPSPNTSEVTVTGSAGTSSATPVAGVTVAFKLAADLGSCETCGLHTAVTSAAGTYSLTLPTGVYEALCAKTGQTCEVMTNPATASARVTVDKNGSLNFLVTGTTPSPQPQPPAPPGGGGGNVVSGHMYYANGQPVADQDITFAAADCASCDSQPHATTGADGSYSITLDEGIYQAQCDYIPGCGVQNSSSGQGQTVSVPPGGTVNFIACEPNAGLPYPQCLGA